MFMPFVAARPAAAQEVAAAAAFGGAVRARRGVVGGLRQEVRRRHGTPRRTDGSSSKRRKNSGNMSFAFLPPSLSSSSARGRQPRGGLVFVVFLGKMLNCICLVLLMLIQRLLCCCGFRSFRLRLPWWAVGNCYCKHCNVKLTERADWLNQTYTNLNQLSFSFQAPTSPTSKPAHMLKEVELCAKFITTFTEPYKRKRNAMLIKRHDEAPKQSILTPVMIEKLLHYPGPENRK